MKSVDMIGKVVEVERMGYVFKGKVVDASEKVNVIWVERTEDDWLAVDIDNPKNTVQIIDADDIVEVEKEICTPIKEIRESIKKDLKYIHEDDEVVVRVLVYDCEDNGYMGSGQTYDVEINYYINGSYEDGYCSETFYGNTNKEMAKKDAVKRGKAVLKLVKNWFKYNDDVTVDNSVEVYHA